MVRNFEKTGMLLIIHFLKQFMVIYAKKYDVTIPNQLIQ